MKHFTLKILVSVAMICLGLAISCLCITLGLKVLAVLSCSLMIAFGCTSIKYLLKQYIKVGRH